MQPVFEELSSSTQNHSGLNTDRREGSLTISSSSSTLPANSHMHSFPMLSESRKRHHGCDAEEEQVPPQAKRFPGHTFFSELAHDVWDSESSSSDSSCISSPEKLTGAGSVYQPAKQNGKCVLEDSPSPSTSGQFGEDAGFLLGESDDSYHHINRILREAHFNSLKTRGQPGET
ncbi:protein VCF1 [Clarias gariepinus]|uniref:protein FAM104A n=1 Tax=Clarias gariepinus TaxID=13013 RepID=UPI00234D66A4|nr:protein FAM104A [Clarias gariepinus]